MTPAAGPWIAVTERMPEEGKAALFIDRSGDLFAGAFYGYGWSCWGDHNPEAGFIHDVTHWAEIRKP